MTCIVVQLLKKYLAPTSTIGAHLLALPDVINDMINVPYLLIEFFGPN